MEMQISNLSGVTKVALEGRLDTTTVNQIETHFVASVVPAGQSAVIDLSKVSFVASLGIRMLLSTARSLGGRGARFAVFGANDAVMEILETTALSEIIPVLASENEAIAAVTA